MFSIIFTIHFGGKITLFLVQHVCVCVCVFVDSIFPPQKKRQRMPWGNILRKEKTSETNCTHQKKKKKLLWKTGCFSMHVFWRNLSVDAGARDLSASFSTVWWCDLASSTKGKFRLGLVGFLGVGFKHFLFSPLFGEDSHFDEHIFQRGGSTTNQVWFGKR